MGDTPREAHQVALREYIDGLPHGRVDRKLFDRRRFNGLTSARRYEVGVELVLSDHEWSISQAAWALNIDRKNLTRHVQAVEESANTAYRAGAAKRALLAGRNAEAATRRASERDGFVESAQPLPLANTRVYTLADVADVARDLGISPKALLRGVQAATA